MTDEALSLIRSRAFRDSNLAVPAIGTSRDRALNVAAYLEACAQSYLPTHDNLSYDRDAIVDVVQRMDEGELDRKVLLAEIDRLKAEIENKDLCFARWYQGNSQ